MVKDSDKFIREIAEEFNIPIFVAKQICDSPFKFLKETMATRNMEGVMFPYLGKFVVQPNKKKHIIQHRNAPNKIKGNSQSSEQQNSI
jgi:hypothetical protein